MIQRTLNLVLALAGTLAAGVLLALGLDLTRAAARGPAWRRRLLAAGLALLGWLGIAPARAAPRGGEVPAEPASRESAAPVPPAPAALDGGSGAAAAPVPTSPAPARQEQDAAAEVLLEALERLIVRLKPYHDPRNQPAPDALRRILADMEREAAALTSPDRLRALRAADAQDVRDLGDQVLSTVLSLRWGLDGRLPPEEYARWRTIDLDRAVRRLDAMLALGPDDPGETWVPGFALDARDMSLRSDARILGEEKFLAPLAPDQRQVLEAALERARQLLDRVDRVRLAPRDPAAPVAAVAADALRGRTLEDTPAWKALVATWAEAEDIAAGRRGPYPFDQAGRDRITQDLDTCRANVAAMQAAGLLAKAEADLLTQHLASLAAAVQSYRQRELRNATCYIPMMWMPARNSLDRLAARLPLVEQLLAAGKVQPSVAEKVFRTLRDDAEVLGRRANLRALPPQDRPRAQEAARKALDLANRLLGRVIKQTCYLIPRRWAPPAETEDRLAARRALLDRLAAEGRIGPDVARRAAGLPADRARTSPGAAS